MSRETVTATREVSALAAGLASMCPSSPCWDPQLVASLGDAPDVPFIESALDTVRELSTSDTWCALALLVDVLYVAASERVGRVALASAELAHDLYEVAVALPAEDGRLPRVATTGFVLAEQIATLVMDPARTSHPGALRRVSVSAHRILRQASELWVGYTSERRLPEGLLRQIGARESAATVTLRTVSSSDPDDLFSLAAAEWAKYPEDPGVLAAVVRAFRQANLPSYSQLLDLHLTLRKLYEGDLRVPTG